MIDPASVVQVDRRVGVPPRVVYAYLTDSILWARWQGVAATIEAEPGGRFVMRMANGMTAEGRFVDLVPDERVVFTWGWAGSAAIPPGSTTVEIDLIADGDGTRIRLTHRDLPATETAVHEVGWLHYIERLGSVAGGADPGIDPGPPGPD